MYVTKISLKAVVTPRMMRPLRVSSSQPRMSASYSSTMAPHPPTVASIFTCAFSLLHRYLLIGGFSDRPFTAANPPSITNPPRQLTRPPHPRQLLWSLPPRPRTRLPSPRQLARPPHPHQLLWSLPPPQHARRLQPRQLRAPPASPISSPIPLHWKWCKTLSLANIRPPRPSPISLRGRVATTRYFLRVVEGSTRMSDYRLCLQKNKSIRVVAPQAPTTSRHTFT